MLNRIKNSIINSNWFKKNLDELEEVIDNYDKNDSMTEFGLGIYNLFWGNSLLHMLPQYKYIARPVYKLLGGYNNPLISVPAAFVATDFIMHQALGNLIDCGLEQFGEESQCSYETLMRINLIRTGYWFVMSLPVAIYKYNKLRTPLPNHDRTQHAIEFNDNEFLLGDNDFLNDNEFLLNDNVRLQLLQNDQLRMQLNNSDPNDSDRIDNTTEILPQTSRPISQASNRHLMFTHENEGEITVSIDHDNDLGQVNKFKTL